MTALMGIDTRLKLARLFVVTNARTRQGDLAEFADGLFTGGADIVELADDTLDGAAELQALRTLRAAAVGQQGLVAGWIDAEVAREARADALLLPAGHSAAAARRVLHPWAVVGRSCRGADEVDAALTDADVDYLLVDADPALVEHAIRVAPPSDLGAKPWFAAGGITLDTLPDLLAAGVRRVAVSRAILHAHDPEKVTDAFKDRLREAWNTDPGMDKVVMGAFSSPSRGRRVEGRSGSGVLEGTPDGRSGQGGQAP